MKKHGGEVKLNAHVDQVLMERGKATGVRLKSGQVIKTRKVGCPLTPLTGPFQHQALCLWRALQVSAQGASTELKELSSGCETSAGQNVRCVCGSTLETSTLLV